MLSQRVRGLNIRLTLENLTDSDFKFTQGSERAARSSSSGARSALSFGYNLF